MIRSRLGARSRVEGPGTSTAGERTRGWLSEANSWLLILGGASVTNVGDKIGRNVGVGCWGPMLDRNVV